MSPTPLARVAPLHRTVLIATAVPVLIAVVLSAFAWTASRSAPRNLPVAVVAPALAAGRLTTSLRAVGFDVHPAVSYARASTEIEHRDVYAAIVTGGGRTTVLTASAASPAVAGQFATEVARFVPGRVRVVDVVPLSANDPRGTVLASAALPLVFGGMIVALTVVLLLGLRTGWHACAALIGVSATTGLGAYLVVQGWLGALPGDHALTWAAISLTILAISSTVAGLYKLLGVAGIGLGAAIMLFIGNPFSGITSAPDLLPSAVGRIGGWMPPGAGANLLRSTAYFHGHGAGGHLTVLLCWGVFGMIAVLVGHARAARHLRRGAAQLPEAEHGRHGVEAGHIPVRDLAVTSARA